VEVRVYTVAGRCVRHLVDMNLPAGAYTTTWDGADDRGEMVYSGLYFVLVKDPGRREIKKVLVVRR
jgi:flagellar hook assembly protein FlgD